MSEDVLAKSGTRTALLAEFASSVMFDDLPAGVVTHAKRCIADALGCALFGSTLQWTQILTETLASVEERGRAGLWGTNRSLGAGTAALVNGSAVHSFELDDLHKTAIMHPGGVTLPAIMALVDSPGAERAPFSGRDLIVALVSGYETGIRVGLAVGLGLLHRGWHNNGVLGTFSGAAGAGRLLGIGPEAMEHALGIAATQSGGLMGAQYGSMVKRFHAGRAAQSGLYAAVLADGGYAGITNVFGERYGMFAPTFSDEYDVTQLTAGLGEVWEIENVGFKWYPACGSSHTSIDAALELRDRIGGTPDRIERCVIHSSTATKEHVGWPYIPDTATTAQMNLPYAVALAFTYGTVEVEHFSAPFLRDESLRQLTDRVEVIADEATDARGPKFRHAITMDVHLTDGTVATASVDHAKGSEYHPLGDVELSAKFRRLAGAVLPEDQIDELQHTIDTLDTLEDVTRLSGLLVPRAR